MKLIAKCGVWMAAVLVLALQMPVRAGQLPNGLATDIDPYTILDAMQRVADWQLKQPRDGKNPNNWVEAAGDVGMMALTGISGDEKYRDAMLELGTNSQWNLASANRTPYHADDQCIGQVWTDLYQRYDEITMLAPLRKRCDFILAHPSAAGLAINQPNHQAMERWSWCDALFMAPPAWVRLAAETGDTRYLEFAKTNWWRTTDFLYDTNAHLYYRDSSYFAKTEANGQKVFWSRGNGWVFAAIPRMLQYLPMNDPDRPRFERLFQEMAPVILACQQPDGLWHPSLLDPASFPQKETSGSGFFTYGLAWGVNQGLLDGTTYGPAIARAWGALVACVDTDGKLTHVQPVGSDPGNFADNATARYGVGAFLLAGSEVYRMAALSGGKAVAVRVTNPAAFYRWSETVELSLTNVVAAGIDARVFASSRLAIMDGLSSRILDSQTYASQVDQFPDTLVFQVDLAPGETRTFYLIPTTALAVVPPPIIKTLARYIPERYDDFAWESDCIAHRTYGLALIKAENTISSGPDVWIKKSRGLIVTMMYDTGHYHDDNGEYMDDYAVGTSRGCGGTGIWDGRKLYTSSNYRNWRVITRGPVRSVFELTYDPWDAAGRKVSETKRYSIDGGSWFTRAQSTFTSADGAPLTVGVGLAERACGLGGTELIGQNQDEGWMSYWQPEEKSKGTIGVAMVLPKGAVREFTTDAPGLSDAEIHAVVPQPNRGGAPAIRNLLAITRVEMGKPYAYYFGATWDRSGDFTNHTEWENYVNRFAERRDAPLQVTVGN